MEVLKNGIESKKYYELLEWKDKNAYAFNKYADFLQSIDYHSKERRNLDSLTRIELVNLYRIVFLKDISKP